MSAHAVGVASFTRFDDLESQLAAPNPSPYTEEIAESPLIPTKNGQMKYNKDLEKLKKEP